MTNIQHLHKLRERCAVPVNIIAALFGVSDQAYYAWLNGRAAMPNRHSFRGDKIEQTLTELKKAGVLPLTGCMHLSLVEKRQVLRTLLEERVQ